MYSSWVLVLSLVLCGWTLAQETEIRVNIDTAPKENKMLFLTVPRVRRVVFFSTRVDLVTTSGANDKCEESGPGQRNCTLVLRNDSDTEYDIHVEDNPRNEIDVTVFLTVNENYQVGCNPHVFPVELNIQDGTGRFDCDPVFVDSTATTSGIMWWKAESSNGTGAVPVDPTRIEFAERNGVENASVSFMQAGTQDAAYYFPVINDNMLNITEVAPILVSYDFSVTSNEDDQEFSRDFYIAPNVPQNTTFQCEVQSFTRPRMTWRFRTTSEENARNVTIACPSPASPSQSCTPEPANVIATELEVDSTWRFTLQIVNVGYNNSGFYYCLPETEAFRVDFDTADLSDAQRFRLRVKDHLRPLWPAIGIIAVFLVMIVIIVLATLWERFYVKPRREREHEKHGSHRPFSVTSTSSGSPDGDAHGIRLTEGHAALRRLSSAKVQLLEEPEN